MLIVATIVLASLASSDAVFSDAQRFGHVVSSDALVRTSSTSPWDEPERHLSLVGDGHAPFAFHTAEEDAPWAWIDLGESRQVTGVAIDNRSDGNGVRTRELAIAISNDGKAWTDVTTLVGPKPQWTASLLDGDAPRSARYLRITLASKGFLHLSRVRVWGDPARARD
ncbi:MAG: discoidin domain-containing protein [Phycisphaerales bacterium]